MQPSIGPPGTKDKPTEVLSMFDERIIGCVCKYLLIWCHQVLLQSNWGIGHGAL